MNAALTLLRKLARDFCLDCKGLMNVDWAYPAYPGAYGMINYTVRFKLK